MRNVVIIGNGAIHLAEAIALLGRANEQLIVISDRESVEKIIEEGNSKLKRLEDMLMDFKEEELFVEKRNRGKGKVAKDWEKPRRLFKRIKRK